MIMLIVNDQPYSVDVDPEMPLLLGLGDAVPKGQPMVW
jgi:hypothetical protein